GAGGHGGGADAAAAAAASTTTLIVSLAVGVVALGLFGWRQVVLQREDDALLDLRVFRSANFSLSMGQMVIMSMAFFGAITVVPLYLQDVLGVDPLTTGLVVLPGALAMGLAGPIIGRIYDRWGTTVLLVPGAVITSGMLWFYTTFGTETPVWLVAVTQTILSLGLALSFTPLFTASLASLQPKFYSYGSAVVGTAQQVAGAAGIALMFGVMASASAGATASGADEVAAGAAGMHAAFLTAAILSLPLLVGAFLIRKPADAPTGAPGGH
ncbi:MAG TPA: MFS transporter, partial [Microbacterium sp.]|nr:MFS transporter [Microbacterium sp.]